MSSLQGKLKILNQSPGNDIENSTAQLQDGNSAEIRSNQDNIIRRIFKQYIKKKIEQEYEIYFKSILKEAKDSYGGGKHDTYAGKSNIRELVGLRVGLEFIKSNK